MLSRRLALLAVIFAALALGRSASAADLKARVAEWEGSFNAHDLDRSAAMFAADAVIAEITPAGWTEEHGPVAARKSLAPYFTAFPDVRLAVTRVLQRGDLLILEWVSDGTNKGSLGGAPPTGKRAGIQGVSLLWFDKKGLIKRAENVFDEITLAQQVGLAPGQARAIPAWPTAPATWIEAQSPAEQKKMIAAAKATWPATWSKHDRKAYDAVITDDAVHVELAGPAEYKGRAANLGEFDTYAKALPDMHVDIEDAWAFGDVVVLKFVFKGTMKGAIGPFPPTNKPVVIHGVDVDQLRDGKMARGVTYSNAVELLTHLGALPPKK
jgi:steroid delta-isomerase-like uncharacterized protein